MLAQLSTDSSGFSGNGRVAAHLLCDERELMKNNFEVPGRVAALVIQAEAIVGALEVKQAGGRWAMTAFSRFRALQLLGLPYEPFDGDLDADPAELFDLAAIEVDQLDVPIDYLSWRLALGDALRSAATDIRMVQDARDV
ncbi:hypothetical protein ACIBL3_39180 [Kribbella sp. NPDC050124]|uniref:hypothetical protein n=1 Tax=Kribbella sp. NPDC050124 TaxID=3364114 RepID=UPI00379D3227